METRQRLTRPPLRTPAVVVTAAPRSNSPPPVSSIKELEEESDRQAGRGLVLMLALVALSVVLFIFYRVMQAPPSVNYNLWSDTDMDFQPSNSLKETEKIRRLVEGEGEESSNLILKKDEEKLTSSFQEDKVTTTGSSSRRVAALGNLLFLDGAEYERAPDITVDVGVNEDAFPGMWKVLQSHEAYFRTHVHKRYVPRLGETISRSQFHEVFRKTSTPVVIPFDMARKMGFLTQKTTIEQLQQRFPYTPSATGDVTVTYNKYSLTKSNPDWGPAVFAISKDAKLEKIAVGVRNFPRNLHMSSRNLASMGVSRPPYIQKQRFQPASAWFGTSTSDTKFHHDCCDNFVMMIVGVKRWFLAPPSDWRKLRPVRCEGDNQSLCWASVPYPNSPDLTPEQRAVLDSLHSITLDLKAGDMLYLPAGWWHHITNLGPTVMMNHWTFGCENVGLQLELDSTRRDRPDFKMCEKNAKEESAWREQMDAEDGF